jgi:hypothetical protein
MPRRAVEIAAPPSPLSLAVEWPIARSAAATARPGLIAARGGDVRLRVAISGQRIAAHLDDPAARRSVPVELGPVRVETTDADGFCHVSVTEHGEPLFTATFRTADRAESLLYASTTLMARLGIPGGRYGRPAYTA